MTTSAVSTTSQRADGKVKCAGDCRRFFNPSSLHANGMCTDCFYEDFEVTDPDPDCCERCGRKIEPGREGHNLCTWHDGINGNEIGPRP
jgi:hypothetical protein